MNDVFFDGDVLLLIVVKYLFCMFILNIWIKEMGLLYIIKWGGIYLVFIGNFCMGVVLGCGYFRRDSGW